jgi:hypothetical protein
MRAPLGIATAPLDARRLTEHRGELISNVRCLAGESPFERGVDFRSSGNFQSASLDWAVLAAANPGCTLRPGDQVMTENMSSAYWIVGPWVTRSGC